MTRWIDGAGGVRIALDDPGGDGEPLLFVHGFAHHRHVWNDVVDRLGPGYRAIRMDLRGHGESGWSVAREYAVHDYAADIPRVLDALGLERVALVAHSLGGNASTLAIASDPDRATALALVDTGPSLSLAGMVQVASSVSGTLRSHASVAAYRATLEVAYPLAEAAALDRLAVHGLATRLDGRVESRLDPAVLAGELDPDAITALEEQLWAALAAVPCPTVILRGAASAMLPREVAEQMVATAGGGARLETVERAGHSVMLDRPEDLTNRLERFLRAVSPRRRRDATSRPRATRRGTPRAGDGPRSRV